MSFSFPQLFKVSRIGRLEQAKGGQLIANGPPQVFIGELCQVTTVSQSFCLAEVIGFNQGKVILLPYKPHPFIMGAQVQALGIGPSIHLSTELLGTVVDAHAQPLDQQQIYRGKLYCVKNKNNNPLDREPITERFFTGIHVIDALLPLGKGQRVGIFAGSGVGKTVLLEMLCRHLTADIIIIALIGERGREVNDFIRKLNPAIKAKSIIVSACSDESALLRKQAAYTATTLAEFFSEQGKDVVLLMDSITRLAMAQREIGLILGEPPTARGYTPSVFSLLPELVERVGNFYSKGSITSIYTVLVEGDDFNEPIADTMRSLLDGHIILSRKLAHRGHFPAVDVLQSVSRLSAAVTSEKEQKIIQELFAILSLYHQYQEMIELGAYQSGSKPRLDFAISKHEAIQNLLKQNIDEYEPFDSILKHLEELLYE